MQMISFLFFALLIIVFLLIYICNKAIKDDQRSNDIVNWILLIASYLFVFYSDYQFAIILFSISLSTWFFAKKRVGFAFGIIIPLIALAYFKYTNFFVDSFAKIMGYDYTLLNIILPIGISFYSFSAISYLVDVKKGKIEPRSLKDVALYLSFFPKLTSGPIQRSEDFFSQIDCKREIGWNDFSIGVQIFMFGLFKKIVLADRLSVFVNQVYDTPLAFGSFTVFLAVLAYSFQIYFDFSGYSDIAVGVARIIGIKLPNNFNLPYLSHNVTEFWKRWHITLSSWLQQYLYISLGGNRKGKVRTYANLILTMVLGGIWHGANWTYLIWGLFHGVALIVHKLWTLFTDSTNKKHSLFSNIFSIAITFIFTSYCWIFFRAENIGHAMQIISRIFAFDIGLEHIYLWFFFVLFIWLLGVIFATVKSKGNRKALMRKNTCFVDGYYPVLDLSKFWSLVIFFVFCGIIIGLAYTGGSPFIYGNY